MKLKEFQKNMSQYIYSFTDDNSISSFVSGRYDFYKKSFIFTLIDALKKDYPITFKILNEDNFKYFVFKYSQQYPSENANLDLYGHNFPQFLSVQEELSEELYISDIALLDYYWEREIFENKKIQVTIGVFDLWSNLHSNKEFQTPELDDSQKETLLIESNEKSKKITPLNISTIQD